MFDFLKKKITSFVDKLTKKEESKEEEKELVGEKAEEEKEEKIEARIEERPEEEIEEKLEIRKPIIEKPEAALKKGKPVKKEEAKPKKEKAIEKKPQAVTKKTEEKMEEKPETKQETKPKPEAKPKPIAQVKIEQPAIPEIPKTALREPEKKIEPIPVKEPEKKIELPPAPEPKKEIESLKKTEPPKKIPIPEITEPKALKQKPEPESLKIRSQKPTPVSAPPEKSLPQFKPEEKRKQGIQLSPFKAITSLISRDIEISSSDVSELLSNLELELLESDVELGVAESIRSELESKLVGSKVKKSGLNEFIKNAIRETLVNMMSSGNAFDLVDFVDKSEKPVKMVFLGLNGTGKTTTIAKVAHLLMQNKYKVVLAAADTFRAAAIEQMEVHADRLQVKLIKRDYGSDPTSVAYDAIGYAKAHGIDVVLIDTAGRQDTNVNLINELKKIERVIKPDLKLYIGESIAGSSVIEQVSTFNSEVGINGVILTKLDCDPKGGTILSITKATGIPVVYIGTGQKYEDLEKFDAEKMVDRILS